MRLGIDSSVTQEDDFKFQKQIEKDFEEFKSIEINDIDYKASNTKEHSGTSLVLKISNEFELDFVLGLCCDKTEDLAIEVLIPIEGLMKPIGYMKLSYENLIQIRVYNPRIEIGLYSNNSFKKLKDSDLLVL